MSDTKPKLRSRIRKLLENIVGFDNFRFYFSRFSLARLSSDPVETEFVHFLTMIPTDKLILDIGANFGIMTTSMAKKAVHGKVYSFEPIPENAKALKRLVKHYNLKNVTVFECAIGAEAGELKMVLPLIDDTKIHGLSHIVDDTNTHEGEFFNVPVKRLDDIAELKTSDKIGAVKIDVENFELDVFKGGRELFLKHKPIVFCEIWNNEKREDTFNYLRNELGYTINAYDGNKVVPFTGQDVYNFFLIPQ